MLNKRINTSLHLTPKFKHPFPLCKVGSGQAVVPTLWCESQLFSLYMECVPISIFLILGISPRWPPPAPVESHQCNSFWVRSNRKRVYLEVGSAAIAMYWIKCSDPLTQSITRQFSWQDSSRVGSARVPIFCDSPTSWVSFITLQSYEYYIVRIQKYYFRCWYNIFEELQWIYIEIYIWFRIVPVKLHTVSMRKYKMIWI